MLPGLFCWCLHLKTQVSENSLPLCPFSVLSHFLGSLHLSHPFLIYPLRIAALRIAALVFENHARSPASLQQTHWLPIHLCLPQFWGYSFTCNSKASKHGCFDKFSIYNSFQESRKAPHINTHEQTPLHAHTHRHWKTISISLSRTSSWAKSHGSALAHIHTFV